MNLCMKYCCKSLNKQSSGVQEWINPFYIDSYGKNSFGLRIFRVTNSLQERIKFVNRGSSVLYVSVLCVVCACVMLYLCVKNDTSYSHLKSEFPEYLKLNGMKFHVVNMYIVLQILFLFYVAR
jgi:hypothetical protein